MLDCLIGDQTIATTSISPDRSFSVEVPDLIHDPTISAYTQPGWLGLDLVEQPGGRFLSRLGPKSPGESYHGIDLAGSYAEVRDFVPIADR